MEAVIRTVYGTALQTAQLLGIPYSILPNTTLNERFNVQASAILPDGQYPRLQYYSIGTGGMKVVSGINNRIKTEQVQHRSTDAACYDPFPFILREVNNDLMPSERLKYALRVQEVINGVTYIAYYLKRIDMAQVGINLESRNITNGFATTAVFSPTSANLVPTPPSIQNSGANVILSDYVSCSALVDFVLTPQECEELIDAAVIKYGNEDYATISEIALCSGFDKVVQLADNSNFKEAIGVQVVSHINTFHSVPNTQDGIYGTYDIGVNDPLFNLA
jgi:hypothetical protein